MSESLTTRSQMNITEFLSKLDQNKEQIPLDQLKHMLRNLHLPLIKVSDQVVFADDRYQRNLLHYGPIYYALILCWKPGQASPIHDHIGATCGVKVLSGGGTERCYEVDEAGKLVETCSTQLGAGMICGSEGGDIHLIQNDTRDNLVTLHIYSPYLSNFNIYDEKTGETTLYSCPLVEKIEREKAQS